MLKKLVLGIGLLGLSVAFAKSYSVSLGDRYMVGNTELKAGEYRLVINGSNAMLEDSSRKIQVSGTIENEAEKYSYTAVLANKQDDASHLEAIEIGGTHLRVDFK